MLIEFAGCSGAGKTTLLNNVIATLTKRGVKAVSSTFVIAQMTCTAWINNDTVRNILLNFILLPWFFRSFKNYYRFYFFGIRVILRDAHSVFNRISRIRSLMRQMGADELLRSKKVKRQLILVDEGMLGCAHNLLVYIDTPPRPEAVRQYAQLVPMPDLIIHIDVPLHLAFKRTLSRPDPPLRGQSKANLKRFVRHGRDVFNTLSAVEEFEDHLLTVFNVYETPAKTEALTEHIVEFILKKVSQERLNSP